MDEEDGVSVDVRAGWLVDGVGGGGGAGGGSPVEADGKHCSEEELVVTYSPVPCNKLLSTILSKPLNQY